MNDHSTVYLAKVTLEAQSPMTIGSGEYDSSIDTPIARDWNDMPVLPGSSIAGALRARVGDENARAWFGWQDGSEGEASGVLISDGLCHWSDGSTRTQIEFDPVDTEVNVLLKSSAPVLRDHVRLNEHGVVAGEGKFDRAAVPRGTRFSVEIETQNEAALAAILRILASGIRLGGAVRSGYGQVAISNGSGGFRIAIELRDKHHAPTNLIDPWSSDRAEPIEHPEGDEQPDVIRIDGRFDGPLLVGGPPVCDPKTHAREPYMEKVIDWSAEEASTADRLVIPGSAIKGALRHRTLFHFRTAFPEAPSEGVDIAMNCLFGSAADGEGGGAGRLYFEDVLLPLNSQKITVSHVGLDRFSGGARDLDGVLFADQMLWRPEATLRIRKTAGCDGCASWSAFELALNDLRTGLLGLGAEWGDGSGVFIATPAQTEVVP